MLVACSPSHAIYNILLRCTRIVYRMIIIQLFMINRISLEQRSSQIFNKIIYARVFKEVINKTILFRFNFNFKNSLYYHLLVYIYILDAWMAHLHILFSSYFHQFKWIYYYLVRTFNSKHKHLFSIPILSTCDLFHFLFENFHRFKCFQNLNT